MHVGSVRDTPRGYSRAEDVPLLRGPHHCKYCLCAPCIILQPPVFLRGSCDPHPANSEKRHMLYKKFWRCLSTLGVWKDEGYLQHKETRTAREDKRDIMPKCIVEVSYKLLFLLCQYYHYFIFRKFEGDIPATMAITGTSLVPLMPATGKTTGKTTWMVLKIAQMTQMRTYNELLVNIKITNHHNHHHFHCHLELSQVAPHLPPALTLHSSHPHRQPQV